MDPLTLIGAAALLSAAYFAPSVIAALRGHHQFWSILVLNFFFGWTFFGWVVCLAMAASHVPSRRYARRYS